MQESSYGSKYGAYLGDSLIFKKSGNELSLGDFVSWFYFGDLEIWVYFGDLKCGFYQDSWGSQPIDVVLCWMVLDDSNIKKVLTPPFYFIKPESFKRQNWKKRKKNIKNIYC